MGEDAIRVLVVDDHAIVREGLRWLISTAPDMVQVGEAANGAEAVQKALALSPDVILMDLVMPRQGGIEAIAEIKRRGSRSRILVLTSFAEDAMMFLAIKAGAMGYLLKDASTQELLRAIRDVHQGLPSMHPSVAQRLMRDLQQDSALPPTEAPLTARELEVLKLVARGLTNEEIAQALFITERTARTHVSHILSKLHLANRTQAALYALREGLAHLDEAEGR